MEPDKEMIYTGSIVQTEKGKQIRCKTNHDYYSDVNIDSHIFLKVLLCLQVHLIQFLFHAVLYCVENFLLVPFSAVNLLFSSQCFASVTNC